VRAACSVAAGTTRSAAGGGGSWDSIGWAPGGGGGEGAGGKGEGALRKVGSCGMGGKLGGSCFQAPCRISLLAKLLCCSPVLATTAAASFLQQFIPMMSVSTTHCIRQRPGVVCCGCSRRRQAAVGFGRCMSVCCDLLRGALLVSADRGVSQCAEDTRTGCGVWLPGVACCWWPVGLRCHVHDLPTRETGQEGKGEGQQQQHRHPGAAAGQLTNLTADQYPVILPLLKAGCPFGILLVTILLAASWCVQLLIGCSGV